MFRVSAMTDLKCTCVGSGKPGGKSGAGCRAGAGPANFGTGGASRNRCCRATNRSANGGCAALRSRVVPRIVKDRGLGLNGACETTGSLVMTGRPLPTGPTHHSPVTGSAWYVGGILGSLRVVASLSMSCSSGLREVASLTCLPMSCSGVPELDPGKEAGSEGTKVTLPSPPSSMLGAGTDPWDDPGESGLLSPSAIELTTGAPKN